MERLIRDAKAIFMAAVRSVQADRMLGCLDLATALGKNPGQYLEIRVLGAGKAAMAMAGALEAGLEGTSYAGEVVVPRGYVAALPATQRRPEQIRVLEAGHPVPSEQSVRAAERALSTVRNAGPKDLVLVLLSGGGSALWCAPAAGISLDDLEQVNRLLLRSGADIGEINMVRKHLSHIKGGWLAHTARPATVVTLAVSDVPGDALPVIASGPTVADPSTFAGAQAVAERYGLVDVMPASVLVRLKAGAQGKLHETPKAGDLAPPRVRLVGTNGVALNRAAEYARAMGYVPVIQNDVTGEARMVGEALATAVLASPRGTCLLWGGETTVTVTGTGMGGRNQEVALSAAIVLEGAGIDTLVLSGGTDGVDGTSGAAGAWATPQTVSVARRQGAEPMALLCNNDARRFFEAAGSALYTGPTHTNVMDVMVGLKAPGH